MLERLILGLVRVVTDTFFRRIDVIGRDRVPGTGPVIFAGNHPNALMDGWLLTAKCGRWPLRFLANAKLWDYPLLGRALAATGAVPVYRREEHGDAVDNSAAFARLFDVIEAGDCVGIFPEGVSHAEPGLMRLKTGTARIALGAAARGKVSVSIVPVGLNYIHRHRFRSQVLIEFGPPIRIDATWLARWNEDESQAINDLTDHLARALAAVTLNAPDWRTLRIIQAARRLYKPDGAVLTPAQYVELNRRFVEGYLEDIDDPALQALSRDIEDYQARLDMLGLRDHHLRRDITLATAFRKIVLRSLRVLVLLPLAIPGALLHLPVGWIAAAVGRRFSYEMDDIATLKVLATVLLLPLLYLAIAVLVANWFGIGWAVLAVVLLAFSFFASVRLIEAEAGLLLSMLAILKLTRLGAELDGVRNVRRQLVERIRRRVEENVPPDTVRIFTATDFGGTGP
ncbi:MAG: lysophospholipid acyltransferase family protein [Woeseiaceae bacterium]|nr:lysophospholipid acyltransferase family protein [Woeseiaceae bacterium]